MSFAREHTTAFFFRTPRAAKHAPNSTTKKMAAWTVVVLAVVPLARCLRANIVMEALPCEWVSVDRDVTTRVMARYFGVTAHPRHSCDLFTIRGVPAASMLYMIRRNGQVVVDEFHLNPGILLLFDASEPMRRQLHARYTNKLVTRHAVNLARFLEMP